MTTQMDSAGRQTLQSRFEALRRERQHSRAQILTRFERAEHERDLEVLERAAQYTVDGIVKGLAELRLEVSAEVGALEERLESESGKLGELHRAIAVAGRELAALEKVRTAADALYVLQQQSAEELATLERDHAERLGGLEQTETETRKRWEREDSDVEAARREREAELTRNREAEEAAFAYGLERSRAQAADRHAEAARAQTRHLQDKAAQLGRDWTEREAVLAGGAALYTENLAKIETFPRELEDAVKKAREDALSDAGREAKIKADLLDKEWEGNERSFELHIESLQTGLAEGEKQLADLQSQLQSTLQQAQQLAGRAFKGEA
jgi:hypothetical protein